MIGLVKYFYSNKTISVNANDKRLLGKYTSLMNIEFDIEPVHGDINKYIKDKDKVR